VFRFLLLMLAAASMSAKGTVRIAASANLVFALDEICAAFQAERPEVKVESVIGSSGNLVAQIAHGAPYDIFLSADMEYPLALIKNGQADAASLTPFATGRLVLWTTRSDLPMTELESVLHDTRMRKLAIANPDTAPYGRAARQTLEKLERWDAMQSHLVIGESISQTAQFVASGNADAGFVALSLVLSAKQQNPGKWLVVPEDFHEPLTQGAVLTKRSTANPAARTFLTFIVSDKARKIFARHGYGMPASR
jgi:molybdate transport system substrate-binding protein